MRRGITPVVAVVLLLMMTIGAAGGAYAWFTQIQDEAQEEADTTLASSFTVKDVRCTTQEIEIAASNTGDVEFGSDTADVYLYHDGTLARAAEIDLSTAGFRQPGGFGRVADWLPDNVTAGREYRVEVEVPDSGVTATDRCTATHPPTCRAIQQAGYATGDGRYTIDPDGTRGGSDGFPVYCEMDANGGGWTRLYLRDDGPAGAEGVCFGGRGCNWSTDSEANWGMGPGYFQDWDGSETHQCEVFGIGNATRRTYDGATTLWDYYDADGNAVRPGQIAALGRETVNGTYFNGTAWVSDIDGPFPDGGDGHGGTNSFNIGIDTSATYAPSGGGPIVLWFSNTSDMDTGTTHALGSDYGSGTEIAYGVDWTVVHNGSVPRFMGAKVDSNDNLYSTFLNGCEDQLGSTFELREPYVYVR